MDARLPAPPAPPGPKLDVPMAQHLLAAADRFQLIRLRCICEQRLCDTVEVSRGAVVQGRCVMWCHDESWL